MSRVYNFEFLSLLKPFYWIHWHASKFQVGNRSAGLKNLCTYRSHVEPRGKLEKLDIWLSMYKKKKLRKSGLFCRAVKCMIIWRRAFL